RGRKAASFVTSITGRPVRLACRWPARGDRRAATGGSGAAMSLGWDKLYKLGTDVAGFVFFHPARLEHRKSDPLGWCWDDFGEEFRAGRLVALCTGSDGIFTVKFVRRPLTPAEERVLVVKASFRYGVLEGRLYWDNTNCLPSEDQVENAEDDQH